MRLFDTKVQQIKYEVLKEVIKAKDNGDMTSIYHDIPKTVVPGPKSEMRCCIYKARAVVEERIKMALGGDKANPNIIETLDIACDECPVDHFKVSESCRGCISHRCLNDCPVDAIYIKDKRAYINQDKCIECGKCAKACPYNAISENIRPCVRSCKANAIKINDEKKAVIDNDKCVMCGACVYQCPFGAMVDKSYVTSVIDILNNSKNNSEYKVYAVIAPSIVSQFKYAQIEQVVTGIKKLGFYQVIEAALGADITLYKEANEFKEKDLLTTSCCPSFVMYIEKHFPQIAPYISHSPSPMCETARLIKRTDPTAKAIFIGPCTSKKQEFQLAKTKGAIDCVITFEELQAFLDAREIGVEQLEGSLLDNASFYGRIFAKCGGIAQGIKELSTELGITKEVIPIALNGLSECKIQMLKLKAKKANENFIEGMACEGGCLNGAACLHHGPKNVLDVDKYGKDAKEHNITNSVNLYKMSKGEKI